MIRWLSRLPWWLLLLLGTVGSGRSEAYYMMARPQPLLLDEGWWRGVVALAHGPAEFFMEVRGTDVASARVVLHSEFNEIELDGLAQRARRIVISGSAPGERLEGRYTDGAFFGRYHPGDGSSGRSYAFWAERNQSWHETPPVKVWNLTGTWILSLGPGRDVELVLAHRDGRLHGLWRESGRTVRFFSGQIDGKRFALAAWPGGQSVTGHYESSGELHGEFTEADGDTLPFTMRRKFTLRVAAAQAY